MEGTTWIVNSYAVFSCFFLLSYFLHSFSVGSLNLFCFIRSVSISFFVVVLNSCFYLVLSDRKDGWIFVKINLKISVERMSSFWKLVVNRNKIASVVLICKWNQKWWPNSSMMSQFSRRLFITINWTNYFWRIHLASESRLFKLV